MNKIAAAAVSMCLVSGCATPAPVVTPSGPLTQRLNPPVVAPPVARYAHLSIVPANAELLVVAGQVGADREGKLAATREEQVELALQNAKAIIESAGGRVEDVIRVNFWIVGQINPAAFRAAWNEFHGGNPPPSTFVYVSALARPDYLVEVDVWAARRPPAAPAP